MIDVMFENASLRSLPEGRFTPCKKFRVIAPLWRMFGNPPTQSFPTHFRDFPDWRPLAATAHTPEPRQRGITAY
jgi:hypothetical protein